MMRRTRERRRHGAPNFRNVLMFALMLLPPSCTSEGFCSCRIAVSKGCKGRENSAIESAKRKSCGVLHHAYWFRLRGGSGSSNHGQNSIGPENEKLIREASSVSSFQLTIMGILSALVSPLVVLFSFVYWFLDANPTLFLWELILRQRPSMMREFWASKRVWIVGASSGVGAELAVQLSSLSCAALTLSSRRQDQLDNVAEQCRSRQAEVADSSASNQQHTRTAITVLPLDLTASPTRTQSAVRQVMQEMGGIDILILNAGRGQLQPAMGASETEERDLMAVNFHALVELAQQVMQQAQWLDATTTSQTKALPRGQILVTSSIGGKMALPLSSMYAATKHALRGYFTSLRAENFPQVRIDLVSPGPIDTAFMRKSSDDNGRLLEGGEASKQSPRRVAQLMIAAMMGRPSFLFHETWTARQASLGFFWGLSQYVPALSTALLDFLGPLRVGAWHRNLPLYQVSSWIEVWKERRQQKAKLPNVDESDTRQTADQEKM